MHFTKWQACGNDFVFINAMHTNITPIIDKCVQICDRHFGIGADGVIFIQKSEIADLKMRIFNSDGSEAEMCGNGIRAFAKWSYKLGLVSEKRFSVETGAGILYPELLDNGLVRVDMGTPYLTSSEVPVLGLGEGVVIKRKIYNESLQKEYEITCVSMGNPHCVIFTENVDSVPLSQVGPLLETDPHFPKKTNVEFVQLLGDGKLRMRVWERGTGITMACGTGTCATVVAAILNGLIKNEADVTLDGGSLHISWNGGASDHVFMTGPAVKVYEGDYEI